jgi:L-fuconolactonase
MGMRNKRRDGGDEPILDPDLSIVDAHHHLFDLPGARYMPDDLVRDATAGHKVVATVYCEAQAFTRKGGPEWLRPLGEVEFANGVGAVHAGGSDGAPRLCAGIVGHADLRFGARVGELLDRCMAAAPDRFRGVRQVTLEYPDERPFRFIMTHRPPSGVLDHPEFLRGLAEVERRGLVFDAAIFDPSLPRIAELADRFPYLPVVLNHMGTAVGVGMDAHEKTTVFERWRHSLRALAERPNVRCKIGGLGIPMWGFGFEERDRTIGYQELADAWRPFVETAIEAFGAGRCMMESNYPPDSRSCGYVPLWNALKHVTRDCSAEDRRRLFHDTAVETYRLDLEL